MGGRNREKISFLAGRLSYVGLKRVILSVLGLPVSRRTYYLR